MISVASNAHAWRGPGTDRAASEISGKSRRKSMAVLSVPGGPQRRTLDVRHAFEQRDQFVVFAGDADEAGGEGAGAGDFIGRGREPARPDGFEPGDVRLAAYRQHPVRIAGQGEGEVGESKQCAA